MKKILVLVILVAAANIFLARSLNTKSVNVSGQDTVSVIEPASYFSNEDQLITTILLRYHYRKFKLDDSLSEVIFNRYIKSLDYNKVYFLASDIKNFDQYKDQLDNDLKDGNLNPAFTIFNTFKERFNNRLDYADTLLQHGFDFNRIEEFELDRDSAAWATNITELDSIWSKKVKNDAINLLIAGKKWPDIQKTLAKRYDNLRRNINQYKSEDVFQLFENSFTESIDPHTDYMSPVTSDNFKIDMSRSLEGIGARLQSEDEYTKIDEIIPGGPAFKSKELHAGDRIVGVAQGKDGDMVDVIGWRLTDVVELIRGPKGTIVRLQILPAGASVNSTPKEITLVRDKIKLEEESAKDKVLDINNNGKAYKMGVITIPAFYSDFEAEERGDKNYKSTTRDVRKLITDLKSKHVNGIIIDLRNNGGGSLEEAVKLTGLFIKDGPVVQIKDSEGKIREEDDPDTSIVYGGPLAILVNRFSASASEIFSGAIQDYGRGLIIGEQTYGKGTVQNLIDLNRIMPGENGKLGQVKLTVAKFYRINGESTQHLGVIPNITFPSEIDPKDFGESSEPSSLPWDTISSTQYTKFGNIKKYVPELIKLHDERIKNDPEWEEYIGEVQEYKDEHDKKYVSLNEKVRKEEHDKMEQEELDRENAYRKSQGLKLLKEGETPPSSEQDKNDPLLDETAHILADYIAIS
jgi:carboxyl-terminal processing protease